MPPNTRLPSATIATTGISVSAAAAAARIWQATELPSDGIDDAVTTDGGEGQSDAISTATDAPAPTDDGSEDRSGDGDVAPTDTAAADPSAPTDDSGDEGSGGIKARDNILREWPFPSTQAREGEEWFRDEASRREIQSFRE